MKKLYKFQIFKKSDKMNQNIAQKTDSGRSMVEILGVLAVIGVLTLGGVQGYRFAMTKWRANDIANEVNLRNRDTWNMYQTKELPDEDELTTWSDRTSTGFPIHVFPQTKMIYDVQVENVPTRVCRQTLDMSLQGALFIWTTPDDGTTKRIYRGNNPEICGEEGEEVTLVFTTSLEQFGREGKGLHNPVDERGQPLRYCLENSDCRSCETCYKNEPYTCQSTCPDDKPVCMEKVGQDCKCVECELTSDCGAGKVCDDATNTCQEIQEACPEGTFRSRNGACVPCNEPTNIIISSGIFTAPGIADEKTGEEMCEACATASVNQAARNKEVDKNGIMYCSYGCTKGVSVQKYAGGCAPCYDENGNPILDKYVIPNETEAHNQCQACEGHTWYAASDNSKHVCGLPFECEQGTFAHHYYNSALGWNDLKCISCTEKNSVNQWMSGPGAWMTKAINSCNECPTDQTYSCYSVGICAGRDNKYSTCAPKCWQPEDGAEEDIICRTDPNNPKCKRQWRDNDLKCYPCNYTGAAKPITDNRWKADFEELCEKCGRRINAQHYCVPKGGSACPIGKFLGSDGSCHNCSETSSVEVESAEISGCITNCKIKTKDANGKITSYYGPTDDPEIIAAADSGRWVRQSGASSYTCMPACPPKHWQRNGGTCIKCGTNDGWTDGYLLWSDYDGSLKKICEECDPAQYVSSKKLACLIKDCSILGSGKYIHYNYGACTSCKSGTVALDVWIATDLYPRECEACGNRIKSGNSCILVNPGVTGVCNNIETVIPDELDSSLKTASQPYIDGDYNGVFYRSKDGYCRRCDDQKNYTSTLAQCKSCGGNRRYEGDMCIYGLCTEKEAFLNTDLKCIECSTGTVRTQINDTEAAKRLCNSCDEKRTMTSISAVYCVKDCESGLWQDINGNCRSDTYNTVLEIGTDETSRNLCNNAGHLAYPRKDGNDKTHWYCSQLPVKDKFINANGTLTNCTAASTEIPNTQNAKNLCLGTAEGDVGCAPDQRKIEEADGKIMCAKS